MMQGLTQQQAQKKLIEFGFNEIPESKPTAWWKIFAQQFKGFVMIVLEVAAIISFLIHELLNATFLLLIIFLNSLLGLYQELKAQKDIRSLKTLVTPKCRVIRDGKENLLVTKLLVPGDVVVLGTGDKIPADGRFLSGTKLTVNEAVLTGESLPVEKKLQDKLFMATIVLSGHGQMLIEDTGVSTQFGQIAQSLASIPDEKTPLEEKLERLGRKLGIIILFMAVGLFLVGMAQGRTLYALFLQVAAIAVAAIPEGLPAVFTITLALGVSRMAKQKAVMRKLATTEGLGSTNIICTDKTGTLTKNEMTVRKIWLANGEEYEVTGAGYSGKGEIIPFMGPASRLVGRRFFAASKNDSSKTYQLRRLSPTAVPELQKLIETGALCNSSSLVLKEDGDLDFDILGDTTEGALLVLAQKAGVNIDELKNKFPILDEFPFDADRMLMTVVVDKMVLTKGAPEKIVEKCHITSESKQKVLDKVKEMSARGLRVLGLAYKDNINNNRQPGEIEKDLTFIGLVAIDDPPRPEVKDAIGASFRAGIRTIMLTGDNPLTALNIAQEIGLAKPGSEVVTSEQLAKYDGELFSQKLDRVNVFARVTPGDKLKIVEALQNKGYIVAVTGDGVNDAPALKKADVGVAMGSTGSDVAKEASDMVILDDNYTTIVKAVEEGRVIYDNILKAIKFLLASNLGESLTVVIALLLGWTLPLVPTQILWINLVTDGLPALAMAVDPKDPKIMDRAPRDRQSSMLGNKDLFNFLLIGVLQATIALGLFWVFLMLHGEKWARLATFTVVVVMEIVLAFIIRGPRQKILGNKALILAAVGGLLSQFLILTIPFLRHIFS